LAVKIGIDLIRHIYRVEDSDADTRVETFALEMPKLLVKAGYAIGMGEHTFDLSHLLKAEGEDDLKISDPEIRDVIIAGYIALSLSRKNYNVLRQIVTFDKNFWQLLISLSKHFGVDEESMAGFIDHCKDPLHIRLLTILSGELCLRACVGPICRSFLGPPNLDRMFNEYREPVTPLRDVVKDALQARPVDVLPVVEKYMQIAKDQKRWQQKQVFEVAAKRIEKRVEEEIKSANKANAADAKNGAADLRRYVAMKGQSLRTNLKRADHA